MSRSIVHVSFVSLIPTAGVQPSVEWTLQKLYAAANDVGERPLVPIKERSLEIFGDEKRLDQLARGSAVFGEGRLTPESPSE